VTFIIHGNPHKEKSLVAVTTILVQNC